MPTKITLPDGTVIENDAPSVTKETWDGELVAGQVIKSDDERRFTLSVGYPVNKADAAVARDGFRDFATGADIEQAAWGYMAKGGVGLYHEDGTDGAGTVVESYIYRGPDWVIKGADDSEVTITAGDWLTGIVWGEKAWGEIKKGEITGTSMQGSAKRRVPSPADVARLRK